MLSGVVLPFFQNIVAGNQMLVCSQIELQGSTLVAKLIVDLALRRLALQVTSVSPNIEMVRHLVGNKLSISAGFHRMDN